MKEHIHDEIKNRPTSGKRHSKRQKEQVQDEKREREKIYR
jgi:hypothetical protein